MSNVLRDIFIIPAASNQQITFTAQGQRIFHEFRTFTAPGNVLTGLEQTAAGLRVTAAGLYSLDLQLSIELIASVAGDWGISLIRSNGLMGAREVIHESAIFSAHTDAIAAADEDYIETIQFTPSRFNVGDVIYFAVSFASNVETSGVFTFNISPSPTTSELTIRRYGVRPVSPLQLDEGLPFTSDVRRYLEAANITVHDRDAEFPDAPFCAVQHAGTERTKHGYRDRAVVWITWPTNASNEAMDARATYEARVVDALRPNAMVQQVGDPRSTPVGRDFAVATRIVVGSLDFRVR